MTQPDIGRIDRVLAECDASTLPPLELTAPNQVITFAEAARMHGYTPAQLGLEEPPSRRRIRWPWRRRAR